MPIRTSYGQTKLDSDKKRYYKALKYPEIPLSINDIYITTTSGDRLDLLANQFYKDVDLWWIIATANPNVVRRDSFNLKGGLELRIPADKDEIIQNFSELNE
jgi:nucleoid-associated protein YgaU|tara:strand:+ start:1998 stop:2303 length:306 start_codon:yes stop_codon:yes gene_type:complete